MTPEQIRRLYHSTYLAHVGGQMSSVDAAHQAVFDAGVEAERSRAAMLAREKTVDAAWLAEDKAREKRATALAEARMREVEAWNAFTKVNREMTAAKVAYRDAGRIREALEDAE